MSEFIRIITHARRLKSNLKDISIEQLEDIRNKLNAIIDARLIEEEEARRERLLQLILGILDVEPAMLHEFCESTQREFQFIDKIMNHSKIDDYHGLLIKFIVRHT